jgi:hypothetical protein
VAIGELGIGRAQCMLADQQPVREDGFGPDHVQLADFTIYAALLGHLGTMRCKPVTTSQRSTS